MKTDRAGSCTDPNHAHLAGGGSGHGGGVSHSGKISFTTKRIRIRPARPPLGPPSQLSPRHRPAPWADSEHIDGPSGLPSPLQCKRRQTPAATSVLVSSYQLGTRPDFRGPPHRVFHGAPSRKESVFHGQKLQIGSKTHSTRQESQQPGHEPASASHRPTRRFECVEGPRPCPWSGCVFHLEGGSESCALDVADRGGVGLAEIASAIGTSSDEARQIYANAMRKIRRLLIASPTAYHVGT